MIFPMKRWQGVVQLPSCVWLSLTPWTAARQASLFLTISWSLPKFMSIESVIEMWRLLVSLVGAVLVVRWGKKLRVGCRANRRWNEISECRHLLSFPVKLCEIWSLSFFLIMEVINLFLYFWPYHRACWIPGPWPGIKLVPLQWKRRFLTTGPPGKSPWIHFQRKQVT